jgi:hypothetical protein
MSLYPHHPPPFTLTPTRYGYPMTLDWIVDVYFSADDDATATKVILDSGSSNLAVAIESCSNCDKAATDLDLTLESPSECIEVTYGSGEWFGYEIASTYVGLSSTVSTDVTLAGITYQDEFFEGGDSYSGILGMAYEGIANGYSSSSCTKSSSSSSSSASARAVPARPSSVGRAGGVHDQQAAAPMAQQPRRQLVSGGAAPPAPRGADSSATEDIISDSTAATPLMYALADAGAIDSNVFAVAMCGDDAEVSIGGVDEDFYTGDINYAETQMTFGEYYGYYLVYMSGLTIDETYVDVVSADVNKYGGLVIDTGTTLHYLPSSVVKTIESTVEDAVESVSDSFFEWSSCVTSDELSSFPEIKYTFSASDDDDATTFDVSLEPEHYLLYYDDCYYWGFESSTLGIFGNIGMKDKAIIFDIAENKVGFATGVCAASEASYKSVQEMIGEVVDRVSQRSTGEFAAAMLSAMAVVGTVLASAFVVLKRLHEKEQKEQRLETEHLLPIA